MTSREPTLSALRLLVEVGKAHSLGAAARATGISQPAASKQMAALERGLGLTLLERLPVGSRLTEHGQVVATWAAGIIASVDDLMGAVNSLAVASDTGLRVSASLTVAEHLVPGWLAALRSDHPDVHVGLEVANSETVLRHVHEGDAEIGFVEGPDVDADLHRTVVARDRLVVVVHPGHPWAESGRPIDRELLMSTPLVTRERGSGTRATLERAFPGLTAVEPLLELGSNEAVKGAVKAGVGPAVLSRFAVGSDIGLGLLIEVEVTGAELDRNLVAVWRRQSPLSLNSRRLLEVIRGAPRRPTVAPPS